jgi:hypothetical protein
MKKATPVALLCLAGFCIIKLVNLSRKFDNFVQRVIVKHLFFKVYFSFIVPVSTCGI